MAEAASGQPASRPLPPGLDLLWGRRERGKRGPRPGLSAEAIVDAAVRIADAEGLEAISMARVAAELGFTTMSLYRYVTSKDELLQLMFNASAFGAESVVLEGDDWRSRLRSWSIIQRDMLDLHPWITQMRMAAPPLAPNSLHFVERALEALDGTGLADAEKMRAIGLISSYTLSEARMAYDAARAMAALAEAAEAGPPEAGAAGGHPGDEGGEGPLFSFEGLLRELVDERTYPQLYRLAWASSPADALSEREEFVAGVDLILDGIQALIDRARRRAGEQ
ncbi:MAG TPA: TetR/AcrR family transcriptional regulator [Trebonia sp.]|jgi:AcrR family transcriptional regulator